MIWPGRLGGASPVRPSGLPFPMLAPFAFRAKGQWTDGFRQHGIFEIFETWGMDTASPSASIRRIATARPDCPLGEVRRFPVVFLRESAELIAWPGFLQ